jgi:hypothetical protein
VIPLSQPKQGCGRSSVKLKSVRLTLKIKSTTLCFARLMQFSEVFAISGGIA